MSIHPDQPPTILLSPRPSLRSHMMPGNLLVEAVQPQPATMGLPWFLQPQVMAGSIGKI